MKVASAEEMRAIDKQSEEIFGIPSHTLMAFAGKAAVDEICARLPRAKTAAVCAGTGNNGGDGFVIAWLLHTRGFSVTIYLCGSADKLSPTAATYFHVCRQAKIKILDTTCGGPAPDLSCYDVIADALLGTGFTGKLKDEAKRIVQAINASGTPVCAVDIPSGLPADGGAPEDIAVAANFTVTMGLPKPACVAYPGKAYCGELVVADIGFPRELLESSALTTNLIDKGLIAKIKAGAGYSDDINKTSRGHLLLIGGFDGMEGAIMLASAAAIEAGAGLSTVATTANARAIIAGKIPELMTTDINQDNVGEVLTSRKFNALVLGCGMGRTQAAKNIFAQTMKHLPASGINRVLIDGDGLFHLAEYLSSNKLPAEINFSLTPHFGEAARITGKSIEAIADNRILAAEECAAKAGCHVLLKGPASIICAGENKFINTTGCSLLATAGSGDVLSGIAGAYLARENLPVEQALCAACYVHGSAADSLAAEGRLHIKAGDIIRQLKMEKCAL